MNLKDLTLCFLTLGGDLDEDGVRHNEGLLVFHARCIARKLLFGVRAVERAVGWTEAGKKWGPPLLGPRDDDAEEARAVSRIGNKVNVAYFDTAGRAGATLAYDCTSSDRDERTACGAAREIDSGGAGRVACLHSHRDVRVSQRALEGER